MVKKKEKLLLFDCDGVIIDSLDHIYQGALEFVAHHGGKAFTLEEYRNAFKGNVISEMFTLAGLSPKEEKITKEDMALFFEHYHKTTVFPGMKELLAELAENNTLVIVSSTLAEVITKKFEEEGLLEYFAAFLGAEASPFKDQKVDMALDEFGFTKEDAIFISDTVGDIKEVNETGVRSIAVTWGVHNRQDFEEVEGEQIVETVQELKEALYE